MIPEFDDNQVPTEFQDDQPSQAALAYLAQVIQDTEEHWERLPEPYIWLGRCFSFGVRQGAGDGC